MRHAGRAAVPTSLGSFATGVVLLVCLGGFGVPAAATPPPAASPHTGQDSQQPGDSFWLASTSGAVWNFGDTQSFGSASVPSAHPIVGITPTQDDGGYWLVASDGGIFAFGDAHFEGSTGSIHLNEPITSMTATGDGLGYWLLASDGGVFNFGDAQFDGSAAADPSPDPAQKLVIPTNGPGYWIVDQNGTANPFGGVAGVPPAQGLLFRPVTPGDKAVLTRRAAGQALHLGRQRPAGLHCSGLALASWENGAGIEFARVCPTTSTQHGRATGPDELARGRRPRVLGVQPRRLDERVPHGDLRRRR